MRRFLKRIISQGPPDGEGQPGPSTADSVPLGLSRDTPFSELPPIQRPSVSNLPRYGFVFFFEEDSESTRLPGSLCSPCARISVDCDIEHFSFERLAHSSDLGCPCCRLIYDRMKEMLAARDVIVERQTMDPVQYDIYYPTKLETYPGRSKILADGLNGIVHQSLDWPYEGQNTRTAFEFFRHRGMHCCSLA